MKTPRLRVRMIVPALVAGMIVTVAMQSGAAQESASASAANPGAMDQRKLPPSYLSHNALPDSLALLPPPPVGRSAAMQRDEEARAVAIKLRGTARYRQASTDADLSFPQAPQDFACALGVAIGKDATPRLYALMGKMMIDVGLSTYRAKNEYKRTRPFVVHKTATCFPKDEAALRNDGSYPSGHSAVGWGWALALAEASPERADALLQRGREFGQSRLVCDVHWQSDIDAGRVIASATVARLHADATFKADLEAAKAEVMASRATGTVPRTDCKAEAAALAAN